MIYWIDQIKNSRIGISAKPHGFNQLELEIRDFCSQNINLIVSLLDNNEIVQFGLSEEEQYCKMYNIKFEYLPIHDNFVPGFQRFIDKIDHVFLQMQNSDNCVVHCNHGLGRSGLFVTGLLLKSGMDLDRALESIELKRGFRFPSSPPQMKFIKSYDLLLKGEISNDQQRTI